MRRTAPLALGIVLVVACTDVPSSPSVGTPETAETIVDALNGDGTFKNSHVFLKPPVVPQPDQSFFGTFDDGILDLLRVDVCRLASRDADQCMEVEDPVTGLSVPLLVESTDGKTRWTSADGPGGETIVLSQAAEEYQVNIHLGDLVLDGGANFRIRVRGAAKLLAIVDFEIYSGGARLRDGTTLQFQNENRTVPLKFRIDDGWQDARATTTEEVTTGVQSSVSFEPTTGEQVTLILPTGWSARDAAGNEIEGNIEVTFEELPARFGDGDVSCLEVVNLGDFVIGNPATCIRGTTDRGTIFFDGGENGELYPCLYLSFSEEVANAQTPYDKGWILSSVQEDQAGETLRTYAPAACDLDENVIGMLGDGPVGRFASRALDLLRPVLSPLVPTPVQADDIGFGGQLRRLGTVYFWTRAPVSLDVTPNPIDLEVGQAAATAVAPISHNQDGSSEDFSTPGEFYFLEYASSDPSVATVDGSGVVTAVAPGEATVTAFLPRVLGFDELPVSGVTTVNVSAAVAELLSPLGAVIPQNNRNIGCSLLAENARGFGYQVVFDWTDVPGAGGYRIVAGFPNLIALVDATVTESEFTYTSCNAFTTNTGPVFWQVFPLFDGQPGTPSDIGDFTFGPCVLENGDPCSVGTTPIGFGVLAETGEIPQSGHAITGDFQGVGLEFSFTSFDEQPGFVRICDVTAWAPAGVAQDFAATFDGTCSGAILGQITMSVLTFTNSVEFKLAYPAGQVPILEARDNQNVVLPVVLASSVNYTAQNQLAMTEDTYVVTGAVGQITVTQEPGGAIMLIDDVLLTLGTPPIP